MPNKTFPCEVHDVDHGYVVPRTYATLNGRHVPALDDCWAVLIGVRGGRGPCFVGRGVFLSVGRGRRLMWSFV